MLLGDVSMHFSYRLRTIFAMLGVAGLIGIGIGRLLNAHALSQIYLPIVTCGVKNGPTVWVVSGMERIGQTDDPGCTLPAHIVLYAARGEYEPFQVVVRAAGGNLTNVNFSVSDLHGPNNQTIPRMNMTLYREHYVYVSHSSPDPAGTNRPLGVGWYPDALIPFVDPITQQPPHGGMLKAVPFALDSGSNQPIWIDVFVPHTAEAGLYTGTFILTSDQGEARGEFLLTVWNFDLPLKPALNSRFEFWEAGTTSANMELLRHKLMPHHVDPGDERKLIDKWGLASTNLGFWSGANASTCEMTPAPSVDEFKAAVALHQSDLFLYNNTADEIDDCPALFETMKEWARNMHQAGVANLVTMKPIPELYDDGSGTGRSAVDIWGLLPIMYDTASTGVSTVLQKGDRVWSYNALVQDGYSPKWEIDFAPINYRIQPGFINQSLGLTGLLYWRIDLWTDDPWNNVETYSTNDGTRISYYPGEGMLVYPGEQVGIEGVVPSMRLKWLREGVEDYEYIEILKRRGRGDWALAVARGVGADWAHWTYDPNVLELTRRQLGEAIASSITTDESPERLDSIDR
jgi:Domain of unknown function (DUF4091)